MLILISIRTIVAQKVPTRACIEDSTEWDQYCLEKNIAFQLCCKVPESSVELPTYNNGTYSNVNPYYNYIKY